ncbi:MAG: glycosyltransferase N-terminal domain-containing protein [Pseudomonadota bacterium]
MGKAANKSAATAASSDQSSRSEGELVWCHAADAAHIGIAHRLAEKLKQDRPGMQLLVTLPEGVDAPDRRHDYVFYAHLPNESVGATRSFLENWRPDVCVWTAGDVRPFLLSQASKEDIPLYLVDAMDKRLTGLGWRWLPNGQRAAFKLFDAIMARDKATEHLLRHRMGVAADHVSVGGPLWQGSRPMRCNEDERDELGRLLLGRPVWLGAHLVQEEIATILAAHLDIMRLSHRMVLILSLSKLSDAPFAKQALEDAGLRYVDWTAGEVPNETTQVILSDDPGDLGLWYRLAPISFMGSSLNQGTYGSDPNEPAAHGSAILYGPNVRSYLETYSRFAEVGAARIVRDASTLAAAVQRIIPPDQSAAMAHAAWDVATQSAAVMDRVVEMIQDALDRRKAS